MGKPKPTPMEPEAFNAAWRAGKDARDAALAAAWATDDAGVYLIENPDERAAAVAAAKDAWTELKASLLERQPVEV